MRSKNKEKVSNPEIGCGEGGLARAILSAFPLATVLALDGSASMRAAAWQSLASFGRRATVRAFDLFSEDWPAQAEGMSVAVSSLCLHHLNAQMKQQLYARLGKLLGRRSAFLIADLVEPQSAFARTLFADTWDRSSSAQSFAQTGSAALFEKFTGLQWNYYRYPDPVDQPSGLLEQLQWLKTAGFAMVDCFWMQAGHAIYGGYGEGAGHNTGGISFEEAWTAAERSV